MTSTSVFLNEANVECWEPVKERKVFKGGLLFLACLGICPGVKVCTHWGCPWAKSNQPDWQHAKASESEFLLGMAAIPQWESHLSLLLLTYLHLPSNSTHSLICHCQVCLCGAARVKLALWKWEWMFAQLTEPIEVKMKEPISSHLQPMLITL